MGKLHEHPRALTFDHTSVGVVELERLRNVSTPVPPSSAFLANPLGLSEQRLEELAKEGTADTFMQLAMVAQALRESLSEYDRQGKDGRNVVVKQLRERLAKADLLIVKCQRTGGSSLQENHLDVGGSLNVANVHQREEQAVISAREEL